MSIITFQRGDKTALTKNFTKSEFECPCGCGQKVELALIREANPRWSLRNDLGNHPTLSPSVWLREGCRSHFFVRAGRIRWA